MTNFVETGKSIEGRVLDITTRKKIVKSYINIDGIGKCFKYLCQKNAKSVIITPLNIENAL